MLQGNKIVVVMPAYNAEKTLERTYADIPKGSVDDVILVDDASRDRTVEEAHRLGIINYVWPAEENGKKWWDRVMEYAWSFCPPNKAAKAVGRIKRAVQTGWDLPTESALAVERELQQLLFQSEDAKEGIAANQEKRVPKFKGK